MTAAKRRANSGATIVADNHYSDQQISRRQQQQQQQQQSYLNYQQQQHYDEHHQQQQQQPQPQLQGQYTTSNHHQQQPQIVTDHSQNYHYRQQQQQRQHQPYRQNHYYHQRNTISTTVSTTLSSSSSSTTSTSSPALLSSATPPITTTASTAKRGDCSVKLPLDILWLPKSAMRPLGSDTSNADCILVVGVSRPKLAVVFLTVMLLSLFLTFHVLYDSAVYNIQAAQAVQQHNSNNHLLHQHHHNQLFAKEQLQKHQRQQQQQQQQQQYHQSRLALMSVAANGIGFINSNSINHLSEEEGQKHRNNVPALVDNISNQQISHPMVFPSNRVHFPKTSRRLPQALIIGIRKCGTRALLEMLYLHPRIQKAGGEVHFFDRDENYMKGLEWYRKKMPHSFRGQITIEKSPSYFVSPEVPERVRAMNASIKLLLIVREPVTRAISDYTQLRSHAATATLPLLPDAPSLYTLWSSAQQQQQQQQQQRLQQKMASHSEFYNNKNKNNKLYADQAAATQMHANVIAAGNINDGGDDGSSGNDGGVASFASVGASRGNLSYKSGTIYRQREATTTTTTTASVNTAQLLSRPFEELAIFPNGTVNDSYRPLTISMYHLHLHRWLEVFPREQLLVVNGDRLIDDPVSQLRRIETFLGIEHRINSHHFYFNETKGFYCLRYESGDRCLRETKGRKHPYVDPVVISKLRKFFVEHNQRFYELIGEDLGWPEE